MKFQNKFCLLCLLSVLAFVSCSQQNASPPYVITQSSVRVGSNGSLYHAAGAHFIVSNVSDKTIRSLTLCFLVFDSDGDVCLPLGNMVESTYLQKIKPFQSREIVISLDSVLGGHINAPYQVENAFVKQIVFSDGSVWEDPFGLYAA